MQSLPPLIRRTPELENAFFASDPFEARGARDTLPRRRLLSVGSRGPRLHSDDPDTLGGSEEAGSWSCSRSRGLVRPSRCTALLTSERRVG
jgi:hypothetical protein